jgi:cyclase
MNKTLLAALPVLLALAGGLTLRAAPQTAAPGAAGGDIQVLKVQGDVYMLAGPGGNTTVQAGDIGVLVVDTQTAAVSDKLLAAIRSISPKPIHYIVNTNGRSESVGGNAALAKAGPTRPNRLPIQAGLGGNVEAKTSIVAHETVLNRLIATPGVPADAWPTETFFEEDKEIFFNNEAIQIFHQPAAQTDGDSIVFFRRSDVIATGDLFTTTMYPFIDGSKGGSIDGVIAALNRIIDIAIPDHKVQEGGTMIVPGRGRLCDEQDVIEYRDMVTIIRDRVQYMIGKGKSLDQIKAAKPTLDFDARYDTSGSTWTSTMFIEQIYRDLTKKK